MGYCFQTVRAMRAVLLAEFSALELRLLCQICKSVRDGLSPLILEQYGIVEDAYDTPLDLIHFTFEEHGFEEGMMFFRYSPLFPSAYKLTLSFSENQQLRANQMMATTNFLTSLQELRSVWPLKKLQFVFRGDFSNMDELLLLDVLLVRVVRRGLARRFPSKRNLSQYVREVAVTSLILSYLAKEICLLQVRQLYVGRREYITHLSTCAR